MSSWADFIEQQQQEEYFQELQKDINLLRASGQVVYPTEKDVFTAFSLTDLSHIRVVILGQDPYHGPGQAHGLSFSVPVGIKPPPSLKNIYKELDLSLSDFFIPEHGDLSAWAEQGVLLLNTVLTVNEGQAHSHANLGWQTFTYRALEAVLEHNDKLVFMLWGAHAQKFAPHIDVQHHLVLKAPHPSPLSAHRGFIGCKHFALANSWLGRNGLATINWQV
jgi:uracil-DNA glycosylase